MTEQNTVNIPLLRKAVEWAEAEAAKPEIDSQWRQNLWVGSPTDVAEDLAADIGHTWERWDFAAEISLAKTLAPFCGTAYCIAGWVAVSLDERYLKELTVDDVSVDEAAAKAFGLSERQAEALFASDNSIEDVRRIAEDIAGERL